MVWYFVTATRAARPPPTTESETIAAVRRVPIFMGIWPFAKGKGVGPPSYGARINPGFTMRGEGLVVRDARRCRAPHREGLMDLIRRNRQSLRLEGCATGIRALNTTPQSRGSMRPSCAKYSPRNERAQGRPGAR